MKLAGVFEDHTTDGRFVPLGKLTVVLGANDAGKSRLLDGISKALSEARAGTPAEQQTVVYLELSESEFRSVIAARHDQITGHDIAPGTFVATLLQQAVDYSDGLRKELEETEPSSAEGLIRAFATAIDDPPGDLEEQIIRLAESRLIGVHPEIKEDADGNSRVVVSTWLCFEPGPLDAYPSPGVSLGIGDQVLGAIPQVTHLPEDWNASHDALRGAVTELLRATRLSLDLGGVDDADGAHAVHTMRAEWLIREDHLLGIRIHPRVVTACLIATAVANARLPDFVKEKYYLRIRPMAIDDWGTDPAVGMVAVDESGDEYGIHNVSEGLKLWIQLAVLEAVAAIRNLGGEIAREIGYVHPRDPTSAAAVWRELSERDLSFDAFQIANEMVNRLDEITAPDVSPTGTINGHSEKTIYIFDEPERHLNPRLVRQAAQWLEEFMSRGQRLGLIATHSAPFLTLGSNAKYLYVLKNGQNSEIYEFEPRELAAMDQISAEMGFDRGELLSSIRTLLFVEGRADQIVLERLYKRELHAAGITVVPVHGVFRFAGVIEAEALWKFTAASIAVLVDNDISTAVEEIQYDAEKREQARRQRNNVELQQIASFLETAIQAERDVEVLSISPFDMFGLLDEQILMKRFPDFPGHAAAELRWKEDQGDPSITRRSLKSYLKMECGIEFQNGLFEEVSSEMLAAGIRPEELTEIVHRLSSL
jgi:predicted ATPase